MILIILSDRARSKVGKCFKLDAFQRSFGTISLDIL